MEKQNKKKKPFGDSRDLGSIGVKLKFDDGSVHAAAIDAICNHLIYHWKLLQGRKSMRKLAEATGEPRGLIERWAKKLPRLREALKHL